MDDLMKDILIHQFQLISQFVCYGELLSNTVRKSRVFTIAWVYWRAPTEEE